MLYGKSALLFYQFMKITIKPEKQLIAEFFTNIGVAWFSAGIIGVFINQKHSLYETGFSVFWGLLFSLAFLFFGVQLIKKKL